MMTHGIDINKKGIRFVLGLKQHTETQDNHREWRMQVFRLRGGTPTEKSHHGIIWEIHRDIGFRETVNLQRLLRRENGKPNYLRDQQIVRRHKLTYTHD